MANKEELICSSEKMNIAKGIETKAKIAETETRALVDHNDNPVTSQTISTSSKAWESNEENVEIRMALQTQNEIEMKADEKPIANRKDSGKKENDGASSSGSSLAASILSTAPTLYQKFVSSFDAVLQNLKADDDVPLPLLSSFDLEGIAAYIREEQPRNVVFMVGAGISTSAGVPDFRSPEIGLYSKLAKFNLSDPQAIFDISFFKKDPEPFYTLARDIFTDDIKPTLTHYLIRLFEKKGMLRRCFTQNIDTLEITAGLSEEHVIAAHGSYQTSTCLSCKKRYDKEWLAAKLLDRENLVARCENCDGVVKPDIIFFGEKLPNRFFSSALSDLPKCDLLIIIGTSLVVQPFASLVQQVSKECPRLLMNLEPVGTEITGAFFNNGESGPLKFDRPENRQDVFFRGKCDEASLKLARLLGWEEELKAMHRDAPTLVESCNC